MSRVSRSGGGSAGSDLGDNAQIAQEQFYEDARKHFKKTHPKEQVDHSEMPHLKTKDSDGRILEFAVSFKHGHVPLEKDGLMQIGIKAPIGQFVYENWPNIKVGDTLPNGCEVIYVGTIQLPSDFKPYTPYI